MDFKAVLRSGQCRPGVFVLEGVRKVEEKRVVFYGRVSTHSDEQLSAFENQMTWYHQLLTQHPEWTVVGQYEDAGVTGTSVRKRKGFQQMLDDGIRLHKYDLIVTRETKRFARNTVDALSYVRLLKQNGIEVFFVSDSIQTISDRDGELRLSIMATIAQEESRKVSENVRAGQRISRQKGVLRGNGNILGYRRVGKNQFEIDQEQAAVVKKIYKWYLEGKGIRVIKEKLEEEGYKTATDKSHWNYQVIANILSNPFYTGIQQQLVRVSDGYLTQRRVKNDQDKIEYMKGNYEPIISEETFQEVRRIREKRYCKITGKGKKESKNVWCKIYVCSCGCGTVRRGSGDGESIFLCYSQHVYGEKRKSKVPEEQYRCGMRTVLEWKLDMIAYYVINYIWKEQESDVKRALEIIEECYEDKTVLGIQELETIKNRIHKLEKRKQGLMDMRADGEITKEEFEVRKNQCQQEIHKLNLSVAESAETNQPSVSKKTEGLKKALEKVADLSGPKLNKGIIEAFIWKMVHISDNEFDLYLKTGKRIFRNTEWEETIISHREFCYPPANRQEKIKRSELKAMSFTYEDAVRYRKMSHKKVIRNKWEDLIVHIYLFNPI